MRIVALILAALLAAPLLTLVWLALHSAPLHSAISSALPDYALNSLLLMLGTGALALFIGTYSAWYIARYEFPCRKWLKWLLMLPLALPPYLLAIVYSHQLDVAGPVQSGLREWFSLRVGEYWFVDVLSLEGAIFVLGFSLYPYVYIAARHAFSAQSQGQFEAAWLSGLPPKLWLWRIAIPAARPALVLGVSLVMMESIADFGVVSLLGVPSFTTAIYRSWYGLGDPYGAAKLALMLLAFVVFALHMERRSRKRMQETPAGQQEVAAQLFQVSKSRELYLCAACSLPVVVGFFIPLLQLLYWAMNSSGQWLDPLHWQAAGYGVLVASCTASLTMAIALLIAYRLRARPSRGESSFLKITTLGYAIPGSVVAVAIFIPLLMLDKTLANWSEQLTGERMSLIFTGSIAAMVIACIIRFLAVAMTSVQSGLNQLGTQTDDASRLLGVSGWAMVRLLHLPQLKYAMLGGAFMVFTETLKELPASILLRPFDVSTLSIRTYELAMDGRLLQASIPALMMAFIGLASVILLIILQHQQAESKKERHICRVPLAS